MNKNKGAIFLLFLLFFAMIPMLALAAPDCPLGQVYVAGVGCAQPQIQVEKTVRSEDGTAITSSVSGGLEAIRIDNPFAAPGQAVVVDLTISNIGSQYPFNLIPLPPNQYAFSLTVDPVDQILYKKADGTYGRYDLHKVAWGSWFGSDWFATGYYYLVKAYRDFNQVTSEATCKYVEVGDLFPDFAKKRFIFDEYNQQVVDLHGPITEDNFNDKITSDDIKKFFPAVYEWQCIRSVDKESFDNEIRTKYCPNTITMGCMSDYMNANIGKLKTSSFVMLTNDVPEGKCQYSQKDGITYCGVGPDGICPPGTEGSCKGKSSYTYSFVLLVPADAPALSPSEFNDLINAGQIQGDFKTDAATGNTYNFGFTESATCPDNAFSAGCHTLNVRVQATSKTGLATFFRTALGPTAIGTVAGTIIPGVGTAIGAAAGAIVGIVQGVMTWGNVQLIGSPIYEGQGIFYVVAPALKVSAIFTLYLAYLAGISSVFIVTGGKKQ